MPQANSRKGIWRNFIATENQPEKILVTGATGIVSFKVVKSTLRVGLNVVVAILQDIDTAKFSGVKADVRNVDFENPEMLPVARYGISRIFLSRPPTLSNVKKMFPYLVMAKNKGIPQIVFLTLLDEEKTRLLRDIDLRAKFAEWEQFYNFSRPHGAFNGMTHYEALREKI